MDIERRLIKENVSLRSEEEIRPKGIIIYSSGFPVFRSMMRKTIDRESYKASVHALIDADGVMQLMPLDCKAQHADTKVGNDGYLAVMVCEPIPNLSSYPAQRDRIYSNLVEYLTFLCRYWAIEPVNIGDLIQFAGTAAENHVISPEVLKNHSTTKAYFGRPVGGEGDSDEYCDEAKLKRDVVTLLGQLDQLYRGTPHPSETPLSQIGIGDVVLFKGGDLFTSRGISTRENFEQLMHHGVVTDHSPGSRHQFEVTFPTGSRFWVNKGSLVRSTLGHVSM